MLPALAFGALCTLLFIVPLLPALIEWRYKRDAAPLKVVRDHDGNVEHFAIGFRHFLGQHFAGLIADSPAAAGVPARPLDPASYQLLDADSVVRLSPAELAARSCPRLLIASAALTLGEKMLYEKELYVGATLQAGAHNSFRAILAHGDIALGDDCAVLRWAHSDASLALGLRARLYGRVSAECAISLQRGSRFGRMSAPVIRFGPTPQASTAQAATRARAPLSLPHDIVDASESRWLVNGSLAIPADACHSGDLVSRKQVSIGDHALLHGNIKSNGDLIIGSDVQIDGSLVATGKLLIGPRCTIKGPVVCDGQVVIGAGSVIGQPGAPTTVTAAEIRIEEGVLAHGTVWAREVGIVAARPA